MPLPVDPEVAESSSASVAPSRASTQASSSPVVVTPTVLTPTWTTSGSSKVSSVPTATNVLPAPDSSTTSALRPTVILPTSASSILSTGSSVSVTASPTATSPSMKTSLPITPTSNVVLSSEVPASSAPPPQELPSGVLTALPRESSGTTTIPGSKKTGSTGNAVAGVAGGIVGLVLCLFLIVFFWRWRAKRRFQNARMSFGPHGNGIDASRGNVLVSSVACIPADALSVGESAYETENYTPHPRSRYFHPAVDTGRMFLTPIPTIAEVSERGSGDFEKPAPRPSQGRRHAGDPFDDSNYVEKAPTLPNVDSIRRTPPQPPMTERSKQHYRSRSSDSIGEQRLPFSWESMGFLGPSSPEPATRLGRVISNRQIGPRQNNYGYPQLHPYPRNGTVDPMRMHSVQRRQRSASLGGAERRYPNNPALDSPTWHPSGHAPPPRRAPSLRLPVGESALLRAGSTASLRERPSPELWNGPPLISPPLHLLRSNSTTLQQDPANLGRKNSSGSAWGSASKSERLGHGDAATNF